MLFFRFLFLFSRQGFFSEPSCFSEDVFHLFRWLSPDFYFSSFHPVSQRPIQFLLAKLQSRKSFLFKKAARKMLANQTPTIYFINIISSFFAHIPLQKITKPNGNTKKLPNRLSYKKVACNMLIKSTPAINFIKVKRENFLYEFF